VASCYQQCGSDGNAAPHVLVPEVRAIALSSSHGAEACNLTSRYAPTSLYLSSKLHDRRRDAKHCHRGRHPQEGSRPVGVVHDEKLLAIRPAASDCVIPRHAGKLARQRLTSDDLASAAWRPGCRPRVIGVKPATLPRRIAAEALGAALVASVVSSGIMAGLLARTLRSRCGGPPG
jgi:hypothetical protein